MREYCRLRALRIVCSAKFSTAHLLQLAFQMRVRTSLGVLLCSSAITTWSCGFSLSGPPLVRHPSTAFDEVPYPPPAALAEVVADKPDNCDCVWVEGSWRFRNKSYAWRKGGWFARPENARYARPRVSFSTDGRVMYAPGTWYDATGNPIENVRPLVPAMRPRNEFTSESETAR